MRKAVDFSTYKKLTKMSLNDFNRWVESVYRSGFDDAYHLTQKDLYNQMEIEPKDLVSACTEDRLMEIILSVKGIGQRRAQEVVDKIMNEGVDPKLWE